MPVIAHTLITGSIHNSHHLRLMVLEASIADLHLIGGIEVAVRSLYLQLGITTPASSRVLSSAHRISECLLLFYPH